jgi:hypothetical protein
MDANWYHGSGVEFEKFDQSKLMKIESVTNLDEDQLPMFENFTGGRD